MNVEAGATRHSTVLQVNAVEAMYGAVLALKGVTFEVGAGEITALLGPNGAGKTTMLRAISNLLGPARGAVTSGSIIYRDRSTKGIQPTALVRSGMAQVLEGRHCFGHMSIHENLLAGAFTRSDRDGIAKDLEKIYGFFPRLKTRSRSKAAYTSGGEQQMCAIGRALMSRPMFVILDEPSMGLAPQIVEEVFEIVRLLNATEGTTFLIAEQNATIALRHSHRAFVMEDGQVVLQGSAAQLSDDPRVQELYLGSKDRASFRQARPAALTTL